MATATVGNLAVLVTANTAKFDAGLRKSVKRTRAFKKSIASASKVVSRFGKIAIAGAGAGLVLLVKNQLAALDSIDKVSKKVGIEVEALQRLQFVATQTGIEVKTLDTALRAMTRRIGEASIGTGEAVNALKLLGLDAQKLAKLSPDKVFLELADAIKTSALPQSVKLSSVIKIFDTEAAGLVTTLGLGSKGIAELMATADRLGGVISKEMIEKAVGANDAIDRLTFSLKGAGAVIVSDMAPSITKLANSISGVNKSAERTGDVFSRFETLGVVIEKTVRAMTLAFMGLEVAITGSVEILAKWLKLLAILPGSGIAGSIASAFGGGIDLLEEELQNQTMASRQRFLDAWNNVKLNVPITLDPKGVAKDLLGPNGGPSKPFIAGRTPLGPDRSAEDFLPRPTMMFYADQAAKRARERMLPFLQSALSSSMTAGPLTASLAVAGSAAANATISRSNAASIAQRTDEQILEEARKQRKAAEDSERHLQSLLDKLEEDTFTIVDFGALAAVPR